MFRLPQETNQFKTVVVLSPQYARQGRTFEYITEPYVCSPPAAYIISEDRRTFTLGFRMRELDKLQGTYLFNILVDGYETGEYASKIEKKDSRVRILTRDHGWKYWNGRSFI